jgi:DNA repair exonuclease SbcCD ATPase subunit/DNA repair exonuclease SbcCD nuclease subunit
MIRELSCDHDIEHIYHVSDIHIRLRQRHQEYRDVFDQLYKTLRKLQAKHGNGVIVITGDILHSKTNLSPEAIQLAHSFFYHLSEIMPTIVIPGNHDANLSNRNRLDALSPIIDPIRQLESHNLVYLQYTGVYRMSNVFFGVTSVFGEEGTPPVIRKIITADDIPNVKHTSKIALCHETLNVASTSDNLYNSMSTKDFRGYDLVLLGDIHKRQYVNKKKTMAYAGSLIQQDKGESIKNHGFIHWDVEDQRGTFHNVKNTCGFYKMAYLNGAFSYNDEDPKGTGIHKSVRLFLEHDDSITDPDLRKKIRKKLGKQNKEIKSIYVEKIHSQLEMDDPEIKDESYDFNISDVNKQNYYINMYLKNNTKYSQDDIEEIQHFNREINKQLTISEHINNNTWELETLDFSNLFSYGESNHISFSNMSGVLGFIAPNHTGKSSIIDIVLYMLFDNCSRCSNVNTVANEILNNMSERFESTLVFKIGRNRYCIRKRGVKGQVKHNSVKVVVDFWEIMEDGKKKDLNGTQRSDTRKIIETYVGKYEDFLITSVALQNNLKHEFIELTTGNRVDRLNSLLCIDVFDDLKKIVVAKNDELKVLLKNTNDYSDTIVSLTAQIRTIDTELLQCIEKKTVINHSIDALQNDIDASNRAMTMCEKPVLSKKELLEQRDHLTNRDSSGVSLTHVISESQYNDECEKRTTMKDEINKLQQSKKHVEIPEFVKKYTIDKLVRMIGTKTKNREIKQKNVGIIEKKVLKLERKLTKMSEYTSDAFDALKKKYDEYQDIQREKDVLSEMINKTNEELERLSVHKYDPKCEFCVNNVFVKNARKAEKHLKNQMSQMAKLDAITFDMDHFTEFQTSMSTKSEYMGEITKYKHTLNTTTKEIKELSETMDRLNDILVHKRTLEEILETNERIDRAVGILREALTKTDGVIKEYDNVLKHASSDDETRIAEIDALLRVYDVVEKNERCQEVIDVSTSSIKEYRIELQTICDRMNTSTIQKTINEADILKYTDNNRKNNNHKKRQQLYEKYVKMMQKNGLPYFLISKVIPTLERRINAILRKLVDFRIRFDLEHKKAQKYINLFLVRGDHECVIQMCSGFEKFVTNIVMKMGIRTIAKVPKPNFMMIDEGFGNFDEEHLNTTVQQLFQFLCSNFDYSLLISHIDILKDYIQTHIHINRSNGFSNINYE